MLPLELWFLCTALPLKALIQCTKFINFPVMLPKSFKITNKKRTTLFLMKVYRVMVFVQCTFSQCPLPIYQKGSIEFRLVVFFSNAPNKY